MNDTYKQTSPLQNLFVDVKKILELTEFKDLNKANAAETEESPGLAELWIVAMDKADSFLTYRKWWSKEMFQEVSNNIRTSDFQYYLGHPMSVPLKYRDVLLERGRQAFLDEYEEQNDYYRMLIGLPPLETNPMNYVYISEDTAELIHADPTLPVHKQSLYIQNLFMNTDEYKSLLSDTKTYLNYLGMNKVDLYVARKAKDYDIIRYPSSRSDINPNLLTIFASLYADYREYVMVVLYNRQLENTYVGYRDFMQFLIISFTLFQLGNKALEAMNDKKFLDDTVLHMVLSMYGIPDSLLLAKDVRRDLAIHILKLVKEKGTDAVYYDLIQILGYQDVVISKLLMMKGQQFDSSMNALDTCEPYFIQLDIKDENPYETITKGNAQRYSYHDIVDSDPTWWDLEDVRKVLRNSEYTMSESKYITIEAVIHQMKYMFESIYFTRMIIDNKDDTDQYLVSVPELLGTEMISVYDAILGVICATCMSSNMTGELITETDQVLSTAGFNFDMDIDSFMEFVDTTKYVDKSRLKMFMENLTMHSEADISRLFNDVMYPMRAWLENMIKESTNRQEFLEYEAIYKALFTYDITRNKILDGFQMPMEIIKNKYEISDDDMIAFQHFFPRYIDNDGNARAVTEYMFSPSANTTRYSYPFLSMSYNVDWSIDLHDVPVGGYDKNGNPRKDDRGCLYFHDILNCEDLRELQVVTSDGYDGRRVFMDYNEDSWVVNNKVVEYVIAKIKELPEDLLVRAYFQTYTPVLNSKGKYFQEGNKLPASIRSTSGVFRDIMIEKIRMDMKGLAKPATTYFEVLSRKNETLYNIIVDTNRFERNREAWLNDIMTIVIALETSLSMHMKYFDQSILGEELFFKPLIVLIDHFKSMNVMIARTGLKYVFDDNIDAGGNSNMFKLFDMMQFIVHFTTIINRGYDSQFGLYDTEHTMHHHILMRDRSEMLTYKSGYGFAAETRTARMGSVRMVDEMKFFKNGEPVDPNGHASSWYVGEYGTGRWSEDDDILMKARMGTARVKNNPVDLEAWKEFVESYNPI